jgi:5-hydroxyisourate hydrolase-like protein (transthyretin family)
MRKSLLIITLTAFVAVAFAPLAYGAKDKVPKATVNFLILRDTNGKPIRNAAVVIAKVNRKGRQEQWGQELKTNAEGKAQHPAVEYGKVRIQMIAPGYQSYGQDYEINQETMDIVIKLKFPQDQHSIYK